MGTYCSFGCTGFDDNCDCSDYKSRPRTPLKDTGYMVEFKVPLTDELLLLPVEMVFEVTKGPRGNSLKSLEAKCFRSIVFLEDKSRDEDVVPKSESDVDLFEGEEYKTIETMSIVFQMMVADLDRNKEQLQTMVRRIEATL